MDEVDPSLILPSSICRALFVDGSYNTASMDGGGVERADIVLMSAFDRSNDCISLHSIGRLLLQVYRGTEDKV